MKRIQPLTKYIPSRVTKFICCNVLLGISINLIVCIKLRFEAYVLGDKEIVDNNETHHQKRKAILLMAGYRGGSTLTGELFNRNDDMLYYFGIVLPGIEFQSERLVKPIERTPCFIWRKGCAEAEKSNDK